MDETFRTLNLTHPATGEELTLLVGCLGTIVRPAYIDRAGGKRKAQEKKAGLGSKGRHQVNLKSPDKHGKQRQWLRKRYQLVAAAWHGYEFGSDYQIHHIDGDPTNDSADNIVPLTQDEHTKVHALLREGFDPHEAVAEVLMARGDDDRDDLATEATA
ncbi:HNH endonuclease [bacterium]|nr:HNH endonuclease [bacterium]